MIDFTDCKKLVNSYEGADLKNKIEYLGDIYMLKFGQKLVPDSNKPMQASYSSAPVSEYLGSHIFELAGIPVQETLLGTYDGKVVVACKDFLECQPNAAELVLVEFKKLENSYLAAPPPEEGRRFTTTSLASSPSTNPLATFAPRRKTDIGRRSSWTPSSATSTAMPVTGGMFSTRPRTGLWT